MVAINYVANMARISTKKVSVVFYFFRKKYVVGILIGLFLEGISIRTYNVSFHEEGGKIYFFSGYIS